LRKYVSLQFIDWDPLNTLTPAVVLVENDDITLELYKRELCKSFNVFAFTKLEGVLDIMQSQDIQAIVIEPEINSGKGWGLIHSLHKTCPDRNIPVIVCSTRDSTHAGPALEVSLYLTKPVLPGTLREKTLEIIQDKGKLWRTQ
jgi:response regulator RpfG family c-di-GMP phosphodiesterase